MFEMEFSTVQIHLWETSSTFPPSHLELSKAWGQSFCSRKTRRKNTEQLSKIHSEIQNQPELVRPFFDSLSVAYIHDCRKLSGAERLNFPNGEIVCRYPPIYQVSPIFFTIQIILQEQKIARMNMALPAGAVRAVQVLLLTTQHRRLFLPATFVVSLRLLYKCRRR